ncbi:MAG: hypothetical protein LBP65_02585 [Puniceicoccales bacterium]|jgi:hypothetical protein|nr:hypothetical protein [Puniceicoccales bacterium]
MAIGWGSYCGIALALFLAIFFAVWVVRWLCGGRIKKSTANGHGTESQVTAPLTDGAARQLLRELFGPNFGEYNAAAAAIDFTHVCDGFCDRMPRSLVHFSHKRHGTSICAAFAELMIFPTDDGRSVYCQQGVAVPRQSADGPFPQAIWGDISRITAGGRLSTLVCCSPARLVRGAMPSPAQFCRAIVREMDGQPLLIVDTSSEGIDYPSLWAEATCSSTGGSEFYPEAGVVTDVQTMETFPIAIDNGAEITCTLQRFYLHADKNDREGKQTTVYRLRVDSWPDGESFDPADAQRIVDAVGQILARQGIATVLSHCTSGVGRSASLINFLALATAAGAARERGCCVCCDFSRQYLPQLQGKLNLAYVLRNVLLGAVCARGAFGWDIRQFTSYRAHAIFTARIFTPPSPVA